MPKRVKINGKWVEVKDEDVEDGDPVEGTVTGEDEPDDSELTEEEEVELEEKARGLGKKIAKELNIDGIAELQKTVEALMKYQQPTDSKLSKILNGKNLIKDADDLTKEEKIVGFFHALVTRNEVALKALSEGVDADGGYLFPNEFFNELVADLRTKAVMRQYVRVIPMRRNAMDITTLVEKPKVYWTAENAAKTTTTARFASQTLTVFKAAAILYASDELIADSDIIDVVQEIINAFSAVIAEEEDRVIWVGNGTTQPEGIETARAAGTIPSVAASGDGDADDLLSLLYALPAQYRTQAVFFGGDNDARNIRTLKDTDGRYLWNASIREGEPDTLWGRPFVSHPFVPARTIFVGDWKRAYFLGDRQRMTVKVTQDTETAFTKDQTAIRVVFRIGGKVVLGNAARALTGF